MIKKGVFINGELSANKGGPAGYLYNLKNGLEVIEKNDIQFFSFSPLINEKTCINNKIYGKSNLFKIVYADLRLALSYLLKGIKVKKRVPKEMLDMDVLHVHSCEDLFALKNIIKYKGKIVFTPHRPEPFFKEAISSQQSFYKSKYRFIFIEIICKYIERYAYKNADAYIFPCENAKDIYFNFPGFSKWSADKPIEYVYTGTNDLSEKAVKGKYRSKNEISLNDKVISFIGRHNYIKGYDMLVDSSQWLEQRNIHVLCAGAISNINIPKSKYWHEEGFVKDVYNIINDSDLIVIPNRNTYFDLVIVEILSLGAIVLTSNTGGNIDLSKHTPGVILFDSGNVESMKKKIKEFYDLSERTKEELRNINREFYNNFCTIEKFASNYYLAISNVIEKI